MPLKKISQKKLIINTTELFQTKGYFKTTMEDIAVACKVKKASLYHHIDNRNDLLLRVLENQILTFNEQVLSFVYDKRYPKKKRLILLADAIDKFITQNQGTCLIGKLCSEILHTIPAFRHYAKLFFNNWINAIASLLDESKNGLSPQEQAEDIVAELQGAIIIGTLKDDDKVVKRVLNKIKHM